MLLALAFIPAKSKLNTGFNILIVTLYNFILYKIIPWPDYGSYYLRYFFIFLLLLASIKPITRIQRLPVFTKKYTLLSLPKGLVMVLLLFVFCEISSTTDLKNQPVIELDFPLKNGAYYISQGGNSAILNYHTQLDPVMNNALDIANLNAYGRLWERTLFHPSTNDLYKIFKDSVYSPCNGVISIVKKSNKDHSPREVEPFFKDEANIVVITINGIKVTLAHFYENSIIVREGDSIAKGQFIGLAGNTGHSNAPHLHIHAVNNYIPITILFNGSVLKRNDVVCN